MTHRLVTNRPNLGRETQLLRLGPPERTDLQMAGHGARIRPLPKREHVHEDFVQGATSVLLFDPAGSALERLNFRLTTSRELAGVLPDPRRIDDRPSGDHSCELSSFWAPPVGPKGMRRHGSTRFTSPKALDTSTSHSSSWRFLQWQHTWLLRTCGLARVGPPPLMSASMSSNFRNSASTPQGTCMGTGGSPGAKSCHLRWELLGPADRAFPAGLLDSPLPSEP